MAAEVGSVIEGKVSGITKFGVFVDIGEGVTGMVHISEVARNYVKDIKEYVRMGQEVKVKVITVSPEGKVSLSMKRAVPPPPKSAPAPRPGRPGNYEWQSRKKEPTSFEDMMSKFKQISDEKISDLKRTMDGKHGGFSRRGSK